MQPFRLQKFFLVCLLTGGFIFFLEAQNNQVFPKDNSLYSRFGLGNLVDPYFASNAGMGGISAGYTDLYHLNLVNPASLAGLKNTAFEVGLFVQNTGLKSSTGETDNVWTGNLNYLALGFPLRNPINSAIESLNSPWDFGMAFSLVPYSLVGYDVVNSIEDPRAGAVTNSLKGTGGTYRLNWSNGVSYKNFSLGFSLGYHFGKMTDNRKVVFEELSSAYNVDITNDISIRGLAWNIGAQYSIALNDAEETRVNPTRTKKLIIGAYGNSQTNFTSESSTLILGENLGYPIVDTISNTLDLENDGNLPAEVGIGVMYERSNRLRLGADFKQTFWNNYTNGAKPESLSNTWLFSAGGEYIPDILSITNYFTKVRYRFGTFFGTDFRSINGQQLNVFGVTAGAGFPVVLSRQRLSYVNIALSYSRLGVEDALRENYFKINIGFTLNDNSWFFKRKFN